MLQTSRYPLHQRLTDVHHKLGQRFNVAVRLSHIVHASEASAIMETLDACGGSRTVAARQLGISERTLRYRLASFRDAGLAVAGARR